MLFNAYCSSMYCVQLWTDYTNTAIKKLHTAYHNILKNLIGVSRREHTSPICVNLNIKTCQAVVRNSVYKFTMRLCYSNNFIIEALYSRCFFVSPMWRHWRSLLYVNGQHVGATSHLNPYKFCNKRFFCGLTIGQQQITVHRNLLCLDSTQVLKILDRQS